MIAKYKKLLAEHVGGSKDGEIVLFDSNVVKFIYGTEVYVRVPGIEPIKFIEDKLLRYIYKKEHRKK